MTTPVIRRAETAADIATVGRLITVSFDHLDANRWLIPDPDLRLTAMQEFFAVLTEHAAGGAGQVLLADDGRAAAVWFDRTVEATEPAGYAERIAAAAGPFADRFAALDAAFDAHHPGDKHLHLAFLAVDPDHWGQGLGGALMNHTHAGLDEQGLPAYLEATNPRNQALYRRYGYQDMTPSQIVLGDPAANTDEVTAGAVFYRMWRPAAAAR